MFGFVRFSKRVEIALNRDTSKNPGRLHILVCGCRKQSRLLERVCELARLHEGSRPDLAQMIVGLALDAESWPLCCEMWPGNTTDVKTLVPVVQRMKKRFGIQQVSIVADRPGP